MPALFSLARHPALEEVQGQLGDGEAIFAYFDTYIIATPERIHELCSAYQRALWAHAHRAQQLQEVSLERGRRRALPRCRARLTPPRGSGIGRSRQPNRGSLSSARLSASTPTSNTAWHSNATQHFRSWQWHVDNKVEAPAVLDAGMPVTVAWASHCCGTTSPSAPTASRATRTQACYACSTTCARLASEPVLEQAIGHRRPKDPWLRNIQGSGRNGFFSFCSPDFSACRKSSQLRYTYSI